MPLSDAEGIFFDPLAIHAVDNAARMEERLVAVGEGGEGSILVVGYTMRG